MMHLRLMSQNLIFFWCSTSIILVNGYNVQKALCVKQITKAKVTLTQRDLTQDINNTSVFFETKHSMDLL